MKTKRKKGFTLAEVLITLAIMGTIMALTIPALMQGANKSGYVNSLKKTYSLLEQATNQIMANNAGTLVNAFTDSNNAVNKYCSILECNKTCTIGQAVDGGCFNAQSAIKILNGQNMWADPNADAGFVLADGSLVYVQSSAIACDNTNNGRTSVCGFLHVDVNGFNGPNVVGRDIFTFYLKNDGILPDGQIGDFTDYTTYCNPASANALNGSGCAAKVLDEGAMNY